MGWRACSRSAAPRWTTARWSMRWSPRWTRFARTEYESHRQIIGHRPCRRLIGFVVEGTREVDIPASMPQANISTVQWESESLFEKPTRGSLSDEADWRAMIAKARMPPALTIAPTKGAASPWEPRQPQGFSNALLMRPSSVSWCKV
jgi:hypothetical protein